MQDQSKRVAVLGGGIGEHMRRMLEDNNYDVEEPKKQPYSMNITIPNQKVNEPCNCGSGQKFKKCCKSARDQQVSDYLKR